MAIFPNPSPDFPEKKADGTRAQPTSISFSLSVYLFFGSLMTW